MPMNELPHSLQDDIVKAGYFPALVGDVVATGVAGESLVSHLVHLETIFEGNEFHRHITVLALTENKLVVAHADDHAHGDHMPSLIGAAVTATCETVGLGFVRGVTLTHVIANPESYRSGSLGREVTLTIGWGTMSRLDLMPATCGDPECEADHGYEGAVTGDDISLRISADAEGETMLNQAMEFAAALSRAVGARR